MNFKEFLMLEKDEGHKRDVSPDLVSPEEYTTLGKVIKVYRHQRDAARKIKGKLEKVRGDTGVNVESTSIATLLRKRLCELEVAAPMAAPGVASSTRASLAIRAMRRGSAIQPKNVQAKQFSLNPGSNISQSASLPSRPQLSTSK